MLGTGTPNAEPERAGSAIAIVANNTPYLIDFGPGVVRRLHEAHLNGIEALEPKNIHNVFVTHLHSDHTAGYPDLLLTPWVLERERPLQVYGPEGIKEMTALILLAYSADLFERQHGLEGAHETGWKADAIEIAGGEVYEDENVKVTAFPVKHGGMRALGYKFITPDRTIVISGDTIPCETLLEAAQDCDVLIHEVYSAQKFLSRPERWQRYHSNMHTSTAQLGEIANQTNPQLLILTHQLMWGIGHDELVAEVKEIYDGEVVSAVDLGVY